MISKVIGWQTILQTYWLHHIHETHITPQIYHRTVTPSRECRLQTECTRSCVRNTPSTPLAACRIPDYGLLMHLIHTSRNIFVPNGHRHPNSCSQFSITTLVWWQSSLWTTVKMRLAASSAWTIYQQTLKLLSVTKNCFIPTSFWLISFTFLHFFHGYRF